jgi:hypothetical protein
VFSADDMNYSWGQIEPDPEVLLDMLADRLFPEQAEVFNAAPEAAVDPVITVQNSRKPYWTSVIPPNLRDIVCYKHVTLPNESGVLTLNDTLADRIVVDTGANFVMIGQRQADRMGITDADLEEGIPYLTADGGTAKCRGVTRQRVKIALLAGTPDETLAHLHILVDKADTYDVLLGAHFLMRVVNSINLRAGYMEVCPDWDTTGVRTALVPIDTYIPPTRGPVVRDATNFQGNLIGLQEGPADGQIPSLQRLEEIWLDQIDDREIQRAMAIIDNAHRWLVEWLRAIPDYMAMNEEDLEKELDLLRHHIRVVREYLDNHRSATVGPETELVAERMQLLRDAIHQLEKLHLESEKKRAAVERKRREKGIIPEPGPSLEAPRSWSQEQQTLAQLAQRAAITRSFREARERRSWIGKLKTAASKKPRKLEKQSDSIKWTGPELNLTSPICQDVKQLTPHQIKEGVHVVDFMSGAGCPGLMMCVDNEIPIKTYTLVDVDPDVHVVGRNVVAKQHALHPHLLPASAIQGFDARLPQDVKLIGRMQLVNLTARHGPIDILAAGFPCQPLSRAGPGRGKTDNRFPVFLDLCRIINWCQQEQKGRPVVYLLENVCIDKSAPPSVQDADKLIRAFLGEPTLIVDSPQLGGLSHRLRLFWTNMLPREELQQLVPANHPLPDLALVLDAEHTTAPVLSSDCPPYRLCNKAGQERKVLPTLVSYPDSHAFRPRPDRKPGPGQLYNCETQQWESPSVREKELLLGYDAVR